MPKQVGGSEKRRAAGTPQWAVNKLKAEQQAEIKEAFDLFDTYGTGTIDAKDLQVTFQAMGTDLPLEDIKRIIKAHVDPNSNEDQNLKSGNTTNVKRGAGSGEARTNASQNSQNDHVVSFDAYMKIIAAQTLEPSRPEQIKSAFKIISRDSNKITLEDLKRISQELGENAPEAELLGMLNEASSTKKGYVTLEEFDQLLMDG